MKLFGVDGIRGSVNQYPIDAHTSTRIGIAIGIVCQKVGTSGSVIIGRDTRESGPMLESALASGITSMGIDVCLVGVVPKSAIAILSKELKFDIGIMITASHNLFQDNGFHFFNEEGEKIPSELEAHIEDCFFDTTKNNSLPVEKLGKQLDGEQVMKKYVDYIFENLGGKIQLNGLRVALDCAHGSSYKIAPKILKSLGADLFEIGVNPNGQNINLNCGSTNLEALVALVKEADADIGVAFDGDADRVVFVDELGTIIDNEQVLALFALSWNAKGQLSQSTIVSTVMTSLGFSHFLEQNQIQTARTKVGDIYVYEHMKANGFNLGGESSGHFIFSDFASTGDGIMSCLHLLTELAEQGKVASKLCKCFERTSMLLQNFRFEKPGILESEVVRTAITEAQETLDLSGRLVIRVSGTEPLIRILGDGFDDSKVQKAVETVRDALSHADQLQLLCDMEDSGTQMKALLSSTLQELNEELVNYIKQKPYSLFDFPPRKFEELIAGILKNLGWQVDLTQQSKDGGYDIFAVSKDISGVSTAWVVECKRYARNRKVGIEIARSLYGTRVVQNGANALLVTTSSFTKGVRDYKASRYNMELRDYHGVLDWINTYRPNPKGSILVKNKKLVMPN